MRDFSSEIKYRTARSGGKGGQNVNKVETKVEAIWRPKDSLFFNDDEKVLISNKLINRINKQGELLIKSSESRFQLENKKIATKKILNLVNKALYKPKLRKAFVISKESIERRLAEKKRISLLKKLRNKHFHK